LWDLLLSLTPLTSNSVLTAMFEIAFVRYSELFRRGLDDRV
jgi:hypothetical protein